MWRYFHSRLLLWTQSICNQKWTRNRANMMPNVRTHLSVCPTPPPMCLSLPKTHPLEFLEVLAQKWHGILGPDHTQLHDAVLEDALNVVRLDVALAVAQTLLLFHGGRHIHAGVTIGTTLPHNYQTDTLLSHTNNRYADQKRIQIQTDFNRQQRLLYRMCVGQIWVSSCRGRGQVRGLFCCWCPRTRRPWMNWIVRWERNW